MAKGRPDYRQGFDIEAQTVGNLGTDIKAQTIGNLTMDISGQTLGRIANISEAPAGSALLFKSAAASGSTVIIYTITAGKILKLVSANMLWTASGNGLTAKVSVRNASDVIQYDIFRITTTAPGDEISFGNNNQPFVPPLPIPAGWDIVAVSSGGLLNVHGSIEGWEE